MASAPDAAPLVLPTPHVDHVSIDFDSGVSVMVLPDDVAVDGRQGAARG